MIIIIRNAGDKENKTRYYEYFEISEQLNFMRQR